MVAGFMIHPITLAPNGEYATGPLTPAELWSAWNWEPLVLFGLLLPAWLYIRGVGRLWRSAGSGRGIARWEAAAFAGGWLALFVALVSPLDQLGTVLFAAHMVQHEVLMLIAAPLLVLGRPFVPFLWGVASPWRSRVGRCWGRWAWLRATWHGLSEPLVAWALHAVVLWVWHAPVLYQAALGSQAVHIMQHLSFLGSALLFWWALIYGKHERLGYGMALLYIFTTAVHNSILGALLTFGPSPWYSVYAETTEAWRLTPMDDQKLAGLIMWVPGGLIYVIAALAFMAAWLAESERRVLRSETQMVSKGRR